MDLWIRSQDKEMLAKVNRIDIDTNGRNILINGFETVIGKYTKKERALEVLEDIQKSICTTFNLKPKIPIHMDDLCAAKVYLEDLNDIKLITAGTEFKIEPISTNIFVYQMPEE